MKYHARKFIFALVLMFLMGVSGCHFDAIIYDIDLASCVSQPIYPSTFNIGSQKVTLEKPSEKFQKCREDEICNTFRFYRVEERPKATRPYYIRYSSDRCSLIVADINFGHRTLPLEEVRKTLDSRMISFANGFLSESGTQIKKISKVTEMTSDKEVLEWSHKWLKSENGY